MNTPVLLLLVLTPACVLVAWAWMRLAERVAPSDRDPDES